MNEIKANVKATIKWHGWKKIEMKKFMLRYEKLIILVVLKVKLWNKLSNFYHKKLFFII